MTRTGLLAAVAAVLSLPLAPSPARCGWQQEGVTMDYRANGDGEPHPSSRMLVSVLPQDYPFGVRICLNYGSSVMGNRLHGLLRSEVQLVPADGAPATRLLHSGLRIRRGFGFECLSTGEPLVAGDTLLTSLAFKRFRALAAGDGAFVRVLLSGNPP
jgi:hypothetical protein